MRAQAAPIHGQMRLAVLLVCVGVVAAGVGHWFTLPNINAVANWRADFTNEEFARQARYHAELSVWPWWNLWAPLVTTAIIAGIAPVRALFLRMARSVPLLHGDAISAAAAALILTAARLSAWPAQLAMNSVDRRWKLTSQSASSLLRELTLRMLLSALVVFLVVAALLWLMRLWPRTWPARLAVFAVLIVTSLGVVPALQGFPNERTQALPSGEISERIRTLATRAGHGDLHIRMSVSSGADDTLNAYASGGGPWARIVIQRGSLTKSEPRELLSMVGHELGHVHYRDPLIASVIGAICTGLLVILAGVLLQRRGRLRGGGWVAVRTIPALACLWCAMQLAGLPIQNAVSRGIEARADAYTLNLTRDPRAFIEMMHRVAVTNLSAISDDVPHLWLRSHPTVVQRIAYARAWARAHGVTLPQSTVSTTRQQ